MARKTLKPQKVDIEITSILELPEQVEVISPILVTTNIEEIGTRDPLELIIVPELPKKVNVFENMAILLEHCDHIDGLEELENKLTQLGIRFNTDPKLYQKSDFWLLVCILYRSLIHLYESNPEDIIVTNWLDPHSDDYIPSEKLVAETIESLSGDLSQEILDRILAVADEAALRLQGDLNLLNTKQDKLIAGPGISIVDNVISNTRVSAEWGNITGTLSSQTDLQNALNAKANTATTLAGYGITDANILNGTITLGSNTITPLTLHQDISGKEDKSNKVTSISNSSTDIQYPSAKCVYDEFATTVTSDEVQTVNDVTVYVNSKIPVIDKTSDSSLTFAIDPNKMYMFGTRTSLTITLNAGEEEIVNEYMFQFTSGSTATTLNVPNTVVWLKDPDIQTNKKYAVSIENNLGIIGEWNNE